MSLEDDIKLIDQDIEKMGILKRNMYEMYIKPIDDKIQLAYQRKNELTEQQTTSLDDIDDVLAKYGSE